MGREQRGSRLEEEGPGAATGDEGRLAGSPTHGFGVDARGRGMELCIDEKSLSYL